MRHSHAARRLTVTGLLITGLVGAGTAAAAVPATAAAPRGPEGSAYGLAVDGPIGVPPVPSVASAAGEVSKSLAREDHTKLVSASALDVSASKTRARSAVTRLAVPSAQLLASTVAAECDGGRGSAHLTRATIAGRRLDASPPPNTTIPVDVDGVGRASLTLNKQQRMADGRLAVTAMELRLPIPGKASTVRVSSATCGRAASGPGEAPAPTPVEHDLPVTG
ncbi:choice-of-anchor P family protein [Spirillospora sp. NBC_00431]